MIPKLGNILDDADVATMLFHRQHIRLHRVDYTLNSLLSFTVNALEDVTDYVRSLRRGQKKRAVRDPVVALVLGVLKRPPRRRAGARRKTKRRRKTHGEDDGDDSDEPIHSDEDEDGGGERDGSEQSGSEDAGGGDNGGEDKGPKEGNEVEDPIDSVKADWEGAHQEMPVSLYYEWETGQYKLVDKDGPTQGTMKDMIKTKSVSVYCRQHGCSMLLSHKRAPGHVAMGEWFRQGLDLPTGKAGRSQHMKMLKEVLL